jgi:hypothetical protein
MTIAWQVNINNLGSGFKTASLGPIPVSDPIEGFEITSITALLSIHAFMPVHDGKSWDSKR